MREKREKSERKEGEKDIYNEEREKERERHAQIRKRYM